MKGQLVCQALAALVVTSSLEAAAPPLGVLVSVITTAPPARPTEAERQAVSDAYNAADSARKELEKALKAQYGKKRERWPPAEQERLAAAEEARTRVNTTFLYRRDSEPVTREWGAAIAQAIGRSGLTGPKENTREVSTPDQAALLLILVGVRNPSAVVEAADDRCVKLRLARGPKLDAARFASVPSTYRPKRAQVTRLGVPGEDSSFWEFDACGLYPYFTTEESAANLVNDFVKDNLEALTGSQAP